MKTNGKEKEFDAVKMMRDIRDEMDRKIANMTFAEEKAYLEKLLTNNSQSTPRKPELAKR
jgi:hypothetical protein